MTSDMELGIDPGLDTYRQQLYQSVAGNPGAHFERSQA